MKIITIIFSRCFILFVLLMPTSYITAQYNTEHYQSQFCYGHYESTLGRVTDMNDYIISYHFDVFGEFHRTDVSSGQSIKFNIPEEVRVYDLEIFEDEVYFCGQYNNSGVVGHFPLEAFDYGFYEEGSAPPSGTSPYPTTIAFWYATVPEVVELTKIDVYRFLPDSEVSVAAVGTAVDNISTGVYLFSMGISTISYCYFGTNSSYYGIFQDVAVTDNYIVTSGVYNFSSPNDIVITVIDKSNLATLNAFFYQETAGDMNSYYYSIVNLQNDEVALSSLCLSKPSYVNALHVFDVPSHTFTHSQVVPVIEKHPYRNEMLYFAEDSTLMLAQINEYPTSGIYSSVIYEKNPYYTVPYVSNTIYNNDSTLHSLARFPDSRFLASGEFPSGEHSYFIRDKQASFQSGCFKSNQHVVTINKTPKPKGTLQTSLYMYAVQLQKEFPAIIQSGVVLKCQNQ